MLRRLLIIVGFMMLSVGVYAQHNTSKTKQLQKLNFVYQQISNNYVDDIPLDNLVEAAITATLAELDPHSVYISAEDMRKTREALDGKFSGVGIRYQQLNDTLVVNSTIEGGPAERAGIRKNDRIVSADGVSLVGLTSDEVQNTLRGAKGSKLSLGIVRRGVAERVYVELARDIVDVSPISSAIHLSDEVGYIAISTFAKSTAEEFLRNIKQIDDVKCLIVDLRGNGGGSLQAALRTTSLFMRKGEIIVSTEERGGKTLDYNATTNGALRNMPLIVLIDENTASASEIFAGAIQDHDRGVIIGRTSFGKGLVQRQMELGDGSAIRLTTSKYKTPSGRLIQRPYTIGDRDSYYRDTMRFTRLDTLSHPDSLTYLTLNNRRTVYGGGGINPDLYIARDTAALSPTVSSAIMCRAIGDAVVHFYDRHDIESLRDCYPTIKSFDESFSVDDYTYNYMLRLLNERTTTAPSTEDDEAMLRLLLKANIGEDIHRGAYKYIYNRSHDAILMRAIEIAHNDAEQIKILHSLK